MLQDAWSNLNIHAANKLTCVPQSSCEAETASASRGSREVLGIRHILESVGRGVSGPTPLLGDNKAQYDLIVKPGCTARTRYFERTTLLVKHLYSKAVIVPYLVGTEHMVADIFTKAVEASAFYRMRDHLLNLSNAPVDPPSAALYNKAAKLFNRLIRTID